VSWRVSHDGSTRNECSVIHLILSIAFDGFDERQQTGSNRWPVFVTVQSLPAGMRYKVVCHLFVFVTL